jgi:hypothetical protein
MPLRLTPLSEATPLAFVVGHVTPVAPPQTAVPLRVKLIVLPLSGVAPAFKVAVSVAVLPNVPEPEIADNAVAAWAWTVKSAADSALPPKLTQLPAALLASIARACQ